MGRMKQLAMMIEEQGLSKDEALEDMLSEAHYYGLIQGVADWIVSSKSTKIITDIEHCVYKMYRDGTAFKDIEVNGSADKTTQEATK